MMKKVNDVGSRLVVIYLMHFGNKNPDLVSCKDCVDYEMRLCDGGAEDVLECMYDIAERCEVFTNLD